MAAVTGKNRKWWTVVAMALTSILVTVDFNGLTVALPVIGRDLDASTTTLQWAVNAFLLAFAAPTVAAGRLADIFGRRRVVLIGTAIFVVGSCLSGLAQTEWWLISARVVQGLGASAFFAASLSVVSNAFPTAERNRGIGVWAAVGTAGLALGPLIGGFLTEALSWRAFFFVNVPVAALAIYLTVTTVRESKDETVGHHVDFVGLVTATVGITALVLAIQQTDASGWTSPVVIVSLLLAVVLLALFFVIEPRLRDPLVDLGLFGDRGYLRANLVAFAQNFGFGALMFFLPLYAQNVLGYSPLQAGLMLLSFTVTFTAFNSLAGRVADAVGDRPPMAVGMTLSAAAFLLLTLLTTPTSGPVVPVVALLIAGVGQALAYTVSISSGMAAAPEAKAGSASGVLTMVRLLAAVFGVAVTGALFKALENARLAAMLSATGDLDASDRAEIGGLLSGSAAAEGRLADLVPTTAARIERVVDGSFVHALNGAMLLCMLVSIAGLLAALLLVPRATPKGEGPVAKAGSPRKG